MSEPDSVGERMVRAFEHAAIGTPRDNLNVLDTACFRAGLAGALRALATRGDYIEFALNPQGYLRSIAAELESSVDR